MPYEAGSSTWCSVAINLGGWDGVGWGHGREAQERRAICILWLIYVDVRQKPTQHCKAIILQLKILKHEPKDNNSMVQMQGKKNLTETRSFLSLIKENL